MNKLFLNKNPRQTLETFNTLKENPKTNHTSLQHAIVFIRRFSLSVNPKTYNQIPFELYLDKNGYTVMEWQNSEKQLTITIKEKYIEYKQNNGKNKTLNSNEYFNIWRWLNN